MLLNTALRSLQTSASFFKQVKYGIFGARFTVQVIVLKFHNGYQVSPRKVKCALYAVKSLRCRVLRYSFTSKFLIQLQGRKKPTRISSVGRALDCRAEGRGFDSQGRTNTRGLKITEK